MRVCAGLRELLYRTTLILVLSSTENDALPYRTTLILVLSSTENDAPDRMHVQSKLRLPALVHALNGVRRMQLSQLHRLHCSWV